MQWHLERVPQWHVLQKVPGFRKKKRRRFLAKVTELELIWFSYERCVLGNAKQVVNYFWKIRYQVTWKLSYINNHKVELWSKNQNKTRIQIQFFLASAVQLWPHHWTWASVSSSVEQEWPNSWLHSQASRLLEMPNKLETSVLLQSINFHSL